MADLSALFQPGKIGTLEIKNRIIMAPMVTWSSGPEGEVTDQLINYYVERAKGGAGLIIVQATCVRGETRPDRWLGIYHDRLIPKLRELASAVKVHGARVAIQLIHHALNADDPIGPSPVPNLRLGVVPKELTREEIEIIIDAFAEGARRAKAAGFDAVEFHGAHAYLISSFLSPLSNRRTDELGGSVENRTRFAQEILRHTRKKVGPDFPISFRMNGWDGVEGGITIEDAMAQAPLLATAGASALHVSASAYEGTKWQFLSYMYPNGAITHLAAAIKKVVNVPVIAVGKIWDPVFADSIIREGRADFVAMGRALLADPELPKKAQEGRLSEIRRCLYCTLCSRTARSEKDQERYPSTVCALNTDLAFGWREGDHSIKPAPQTKKVVVIGGGIAGMEAARVLAKRGHHVLLYEGSEALGGQWNLASVQDYKKDGGFGAVTERLIADIKSLGVEITLNTWVDRELVEKVRPDAVILATGATPDLLAIPGVNGKNVVQAWDVIAGRSAIGGQNVIVVGGRYTGMETALQLAERGKKVSIITRSQLGRDVTAFIRRTLKDKLIENGVYVYTHSPVVEIRENGVKFIDDDEFRFLKGDTVILALGSRSENGLAQELEEVVPELYTIGDAVDPRDLFYAMHEANEVARRV